MPPGPDGVPPPAVGEEVYVPDELSLEHGADDRRGGRARVSAVSIGVSAGRPCVFIEVEGDPGTRHNWSQVLGPEQAALAARHAAARAGAAPDERPAFNPSPHRTWAPASSDRPVKTISARPGARRRSP